MTFTVVGIQARLLIEDSQGSPKEVIGQAVMHHHPSSQRPPDWKAEIHAEFLAEVQGQLTSIFHSIVTDVYAQLQRLQPIVHSAPPPLPSYPVVGAKGCQWIGAALCWICSPGFSNRIPNQGVMIVSDDCQGDDRGILGMNIILACWDTIFHCDPTQDRYFSASIQPAMHNEWEQAFAQC
ncbi:UNVERIFIED_CONTAM: hypothetical protein FKN15_034754 [Acipenser sinensis]